jgi:hypothetical protein
MNSKSILIFTVAVLLPLAGFAQTPPAPPNPPNPPNPPAPPSPPSQHERMPKEPVTFLGVETSPVPTVVSEQLGLAKGFGLVVDYVVPDGPAAAAGIQQCDILKMLNDQILTEPGQLSKLVRSYSEGTTITLTILRKGQEQKITVKLAKKEVPKRNAFGPGREGRWDFNHEMGNVDLSELREKLQTMKEELKEQATERHDMIHDAVMKAHEEAARAREEARRAGEQIKITRTDDSGLKTTKIDMGKAQIVFCDGKGELRIDNAEGKKILTAKDPQGRLLFSGPVETKEDIDKLPAEVKERFEKLQQKDLPSVVSSDDTDDDDDSGDMNDEQNDTPPVEQVSVQSIFRNVWAFRTVLI